MNVAPEVSVIVDPRKQKETIFSRAPKNCSRSFLIELVWKVLSSTFFGTFLDRYLSTLCVSRTKKSV